MNDELVRVYTSQGAMAHYRRAGLSSLYGTALCGYSPFWSVPIGWHGPGAPFPTREELDEAKRRPLCKRCKRKANS